MTTAVKTSLKKMNLRSLKRNRVYLDLRNMSKNDDGSENVRKKTFFHLVASIWTRSICQMQLTSPGVEFLRILFRFKKRKEN